MTKNIWIKIENSKMEQTTEMLASARREVEKEGGELMETCCHLVFSDDHMKYVK